MFGKEIFTLFQNAQIMRLLVYEMKQVFINEMIIFIDIKRFCLDTQSSKSIYQTTINNRLGLINDENFFWQQDEKLVFLAHCTQHLSANTGNKDCMK